MENEQPGKDAASQTPKKQNWERELLEKLAFDSHAESRKARRWGLFFKLFIILLKLRPGILERARLFLKFLIRRLQFLLLDLKLFIKRLSFLK